MCLLSPAMAAHLCRGFSFIHFFSGGFGSIKFVSVGFGSIGFGAIAFDRKHLVTRNAQAIRTRYWLTDCGFHQLEPWSVLPRLDSSHCRQLPSDVFSKAHSSTHVSAKPTLLLISMTLPTHTHKQHQAHRIGIHHSSKRIVGIIV